MPSFVAAATAGGSSVTTVTVNVPAGTADGDLMLAWLSANDLAELTPAPGWELVNRRTVGQNVASWLYVRVADQEPANHTWTWNGPHNHHVICTSWRDTDGIRAWDVASSDSAQTLNLPQVAAEAGDALVALGFHWSGMTGSQPTWPAPLTTVATQSTMLSAAWETNLPAGDTEPYTCSSINLGHMSVMAVVLAPAVEGIEAEALELEVEVDLGPTVMALSPALAATPFAVEVDAGAPTASVAASVEAEPLAARARYGAAAMEGSEPPEPDPWVAVPERQELPPVTDWRYYAFRALSREWVHRELPLRAVAITHTLTGPGALTASIEPTYADLIGADGQPVLREWDTIIVAEAGGQLRGGGILTSMEITGDSLSLDCSGFAAYPADMPLTATLSWGGTTAGRTGNGIDPATVIRALWDHLQSQPDGNLGVTLADFTTPYRLGEWQNARKLPTEHEPNPSAADVQEPPIPIDRVWTSDDRRPAAATGKTLYWDYVLAWHDDVEVGAKLDELCKQVPIDYREVWRWASPEREAVVLHLEFGYPRLGRRTADLRFVEGENVADVVVLKRSGEDYANSVVGYGAGEGSKQLRQTVTQRDGRLRRVRTVDAEDVGTAAALKAIASDELARARQVVDIAGFTVANHPNAELGSFGVGDDVLVQTTFGWQPTSMWVRITEYTFSPDGDTVEITCTRSDSFDYSGRTGGP